VAGRADQHPLAGAQHLGGLVQHGLHQPGVLVVLGGQGQRAPAGLDRVEPAHTPLGLRHHLVGQDEDVAVGQVRRRRRRDQRGEVVARAHVREDVQRAHDQSGG
jgi:hypothetical protein